jgi:leader peptidase (prepilin peptidase) / N-methyltransferase
VTLAALPAVLAVVLYVGVTAAGLLAGAGMNALADRVWGVDAPLRRAGDCAKCAAPLPVSRFVPFLNVMASRRRCARCGQPASMRRPMVEIGLALAYPLVLARVLDPGKPVYLSAWAIFAIDAVALAALAFIFAVDFEHRLILDVSIYPPAAGLLLVALLFDHKALAGMLFGVALCGGLFALLYALGWLLYREEALGFGDVKLAVLIGLVAGWPGAVTALVIGSLVGAAASVLLLGLGSASRRTFIPFGIFLVAGAAASLILVPPYW